MANLLVTYLVARGFPAGFAVCVGFILWHFWGGAMAKTAKALCEDRAKIKADMAKIAGDMERLRAENKAVDDKGVETPEWAGAKASFARAKADCDALTTHIDAMLAIEREAAPVNPGPSSVVDFGKAGGDGSPAVNDATRATAIQAWFAAHSSQPDRFRMTEQQHAACKAAGLNPESRDWGRPGAELVIRLHDTASIRGVQDAWSSSSRAFARANALRASQQYGAALSSVNGQTGGTLVAPEVMTSEVEINMLAYGGILQAADIMRTAGRERVRWPTIDDTGNTGRRLDESKPTTSTAQPTTSAIYWDVYKYTSDAILVPYELLVGTPFNLVAILGAMLGERIGRKLAVDLTTGTGNSQPKGLITAATSYSAASATAISWADLDNLIAAVDPSQRMGAAFMFHDAIRNNLRQLKDGIGRPLWLEGPNSTEPGALKGYPWYINQAMDSTVASGKKTIVFGNLKKYKVRQVSEIRIYRLVERYRENDQDAFLAFAEADGNLLDAGTAPVKYLSH